MSTSLVSHSSQDLEKKDKDALDNQQYSTHLVDLNAQEDLFEEGSVDAVYQAKARVLNAAIREIGMGRYQVSYFVIFVENDSGSGLAQHSGIFSRLPALGGSRTFSS